MEIKTVPIEALSEDPANVRLHNEKNIKAIKASLKRFGQQTPIVVDGNLVVRAGNGRLRAAIELGWETIDVVQSDLPMSELTAFAIADNRTAELAEWDMDALQKQLAALDAEGISYDELGFEWPDDHDQNPNKGTEGLTDPDEVPEVTESIVKRGEIWQLGSHRLMCGDSTSKGDVERLMDGRKADMVFTDPPYGISEACDRVEHVKTFKKQGIAKKGSYKNIIGDESIETAMRAIDVARSLDADCNIFWGGNYYNLEPSPCWIVWDKRVEENQSDLNSDCELAYVDHKHKASVRIFRHLWKGMIKASEQNEARVHPTQKPIALAEWCFDKYGNPKSVLDLFLGSGSTLIACEKTGRTCYGMEIDPHYCDVIIKRWEDFTGRKAERATR